MGIQKYMKTISPLQVDSIGVLLPKSIRFRFYRGSENVKCDNSFIGAPVQIKLHDDINVVSSYIKQNCKVGFIASYTQYLGLVMNGNLMPLALLQHLLGDFG